jgi:hypothetical protein
MHVLTNHVTTATRALSSRQLGIQATLLAATCTTERFAALMTPARPRLHTLVITGVVDQLPGTVATGVTQHRLVEITPVTSVS